MRHRPHLLVEGPWEQSELNVSAETSRHLSTVLRIEDGASVTYSNGGGRWGRGLWTGSRIERGNEENVRRSNPILTLAVAAPKPKDRQRFIVEKSQELGVKRLVWLATDHGEGRPVSDAKMQAWARGALEQSRGAWLMEIRTGVRLTGIPDAVLLDPESSVALASLDPGPAITVAVGPEGGFSPAEVGAAAVLASIPTNVLRTDTAAIAAAAILLGS